MDIEKRDLPSSKSNNFQTLANNNVYKSVSNEHWSWNPRGRGDVAAAQGYTRGGQTRKRREKLMTVKKSNGSTVTQYSKHTKQAAAVQGSMTESHGDRDYWLAGNVSKFKRLV